MTIPPLDLVKKLGPDFDYSALGRFQSSAGFGQLPQQIQDAVNGVLKLGQDVALVSRPAPVDRIGEGAFPGPDTQKGPTGNAASFEDQAWSLVHNLPGIGMVSQINRAYHRAKNENIPFMQALGVEQQLTSQTAQEFMHQLTAGLIKSPQVSEDQLVAFNTVTKPVAALGAMGLQGGLVVDGLTLGKGIPSVAAKLENLPQRLVDVGIGAASFGTLDALRADGIPSDPSVLDPSGHFAKKLASVGVPDRLALGISGSTVGGLLGGAFLGVARGLEWGRATRLLNQATPEEFEAIRKVLGDMGYTSDLGTSKINLARLWSKAMTKVANNSELAGLASENISREEWVLQSIYGSADFALPSEDARYVTGILRGQPGAMSIARGISDPSQAVAVADKLGLKVDIISLERPMEQPKGVKVFHGTNAAFERFNPAMNDPHALYGPGFYFTEDPAIASEYTNKGAQMYAPADQLSARIERNKASLASGQLDGKPMTPGQKFSLERAVREDTKELEKAGSPNVQMARLDLQRPFDIEKTYPTTSAYKKEYTRITGEPYKNATGGPKVPESATGKPLDNNQLYYDVEGFVVRKGVPAEGQLGGKAAVNKLLEDSGYDGIKHVGGRIHGEVEHQVHIAFNENQILPPAAPPTYDLIISRPNYQYTPFKDAGAVVRRGTRVVTDAAKDAKRDLFAQQTPDLFILADGSTVRGGFDVGELGRKLKVQAPVVDGVPRPDLGVREHTRMVNMAIKDDNSLVIDLPRSLTQEQFDALGPALNTHRFDKVTVKFGGEVKELTSPLGQQVQDQVVKMVPPVKTTSKITPQLIRQFKKEGVFQGQAAVLDNGSPVTILRKGDHLYVRDPITNTIQKVHPDRVTPLPTNVEGEMAPSNLFNDFLDPVEKEALAKYRLAQMEGLDKPITDWNGLRRFATSRGFFVTKAKSGYELVRAADNGSMKFTDLKAAIAYLRKYDAPMPDLTPDIIKRVLGGNTNIGFHLQQSGPPDFGELIPIPQEHVLKALEGNIAGRGPGAIQMFMTPTRGLALDLDRKYGTKFYPLFANLQERMVARQNFESLWVHGKGGNLPEGVTPLKKIMAMAGPEANQERITTWLETPQAGKAELEKEMTPREVSAAKSLKTWYNNMFNQFGVEADYVENYAPRWREAAPQFGNNPGEIVKNIMPGDPLAPQRALNFYADNYRIGQLDVYERRAFVAAKKYLTAGTGNRFMKEPVQQAQAMVKQLAQVNRGLAFPMGYFLQAIQGTEFAEQRLALSESFQRMLESLPGSVPQKQITDLTDRMTTAWMGAVYTSTLGFRVPTALRNVGTGLMMSWPLFSGTKAKYLESIGMALTRHGFEEAVKDGAIALKTSPIYESERLSATLSQIGNENSTARKVAESFDELSQASFWMYERADEYTRAQTYWASRLQAEDAIATFGKKVVGASPEAVEKARQALIVDSGIHMQDKQIVDEFMRRLTISPDLAARYAGKQAADVVNFLYGRGMQPRWMRGIQGRLLGQFGTWSLWYIDYLRRTTQALATNSGTAAAAKFLAKHALVNGAIGYAGAKLGVDLGSWMTFPSVFYSGGPGFQVAQGLSTLARGLQGISAGGDPYSQQKMNSGLQILNSTLPSMIPFRYAARDAYRLVTADTPEERLAAFVGSKPNPDIDAERKLRMILGDPVEPFSTSSWVLSEMANSMAAGTPTAIPDSQIEGGASSMPVQLQGQAGQQIGTAPAPARPPIVPPPTATLMPTAAPKLPGRVPIPGEVVSPAESRPPRGF